jgi:Domain of unknown function (DUF4153)
MNKPYPKYLLLVGLLQGLTMWFLLREGQTLYWGALYAAFAFPLAIYCTQDVPTLPKRVRFWAVLAFGLCFAGLGMYAVWVNIGSTGTMHIFGERRQGLPRFRDVSAAVVLAFVAVTLLGGFDFKARRWDYARLFDLAWRNGILLVTSLVMVGLFWSVLGAGAALMTSIGIEDVATLIQTPVFMSTSICLVASAAFGLGLTRAGMTETIRRFVLSMTAWLLPMVLLFVAMWVISVPFAGLTGRASSGFSAKILMWFAALAIAFASSAYQDGQRGQVLPGLLARLTRWAWLGLIPALAVVAWALVVRIAQHGFSEDRIWAVFLLVVLAVHVLGYAASVFQSNTWLPSIAKSNIAGALVFCIGLLAFLSPIASVQRLSVSLHLKHIAARYEAAPTAEVKPDWPYLRNDSGRFGVEALQRLAEGSGPHNHSAWAKQAKAMLEAKTSGGALAAAKPAAPTPQTLSQILPVYPVPNTLPPGFVTYALAMYADSGRTSDDSRLYTCLTDEGSCNAWVGDLNGDGAADVIVFPTTRNGISYHFGALYSEREGAWHHIATVKALSPTFDTPPSKLQIAKPEAPRWNDLMVDRQRFYVSD